MGILLMNMCRKITDVGVDYLIGGLDVLSFSLKHLSLDFSG